MHSCLVVRQIVLQKVAIDWGVVDCADTGPVALVPDSFTSPWSIAP